ncbi:hypothetical protein ACO1B2_10180 [Staphylococcus saprophyticus]|uniref:hypothetical protein n=1 Tax=Staphylococcus saprophyticus TaxID=29385 RepID=UPI003BF75A0C
MPNTPNSEFHKMLKQITESHNKEMSKIYSKRNFVPPIVFNIDLPKIEAPNIDLDFKSLNINSLLGDYFKENPISEKLQKAVIENIKTIDFDSFKLYSDNDENNNEKVIKYGEIKVSAYTEVSNTTYVKMTPPKVTSETYIEDIEPPKDETATAKKNKELTEYSILLNEFLAFGFDGHSVYSIYYDGIIPIQYLVLIHTLHFIVLYLLVQKRYQQDLIIKENEKE